MRYPHTYRRVHQSPPVSQVLRGAARDTGLRVAAFVCVKMKKSG